MKTLKRRYFLLALAFVPALAAGLMGQQNLTPHIGYVYPAGGMQGATLQVKVGGQRLGPVTNVYVSGEGIQATVVESEKPLTQKQVNDMREQLKLIQEKRTNALAAGTRAALTPEEMRTAMAIRQKLAQFQKRMVNPAIADMVTVKLTIATNAEPGARELRLGTPGALSQPLLFCVSQLPEFDKPEPSPASQFATPNKQRNANVQIAAAPVESRVSLPCVVNGQILPGGVDRYRFHVRKGQKLVIAAAARELMPYLADAVPGWFQAVLSLYDSQGREVAYADHFRFHPDPVLYYEVPKDGDYAFQIRDSIYRGREDFVYRVTAGEVPYITGIFPLGGRAGARTTVKLTGWNLPATELTEDERGAAPGVYPLCARTETNVSNNRPFAVDTLPECFARKSNHSQATAQGVVLPIIVNGNIDKPGQWDVFRFQGEAGQEIVAEVIARRLDSPLDSVLKLTDEDGKQLAFNDDFEDKGAGLQTQYADSYLRVKLPAVGSYYLWLGDAQQQGGPDYAYRLRVSPPRPDFELRVAPSSVTVRGGMCVPLTVYALRRDGFSNEITLSLKDAPAGFQLSGATVPANQDQVRVTLAATTYSGQGPVNISVQGRATIQDHEVVRPGVPAEDMMQAFAYWHLVPCKGLEVTFAGRFQGRRGRGLGVLDPTPVKIPVGGTAEVRVGTPGNGYATNFQLELNEPPEGITIASVSPVDGGAGIMLHSDASKTKPGVKGNLIVDVVNKRQGNGPAGKPRSNQQRTTVGTLPAIPFEIVAP